MKIVELKYFSEVANSGSFLIAAQKNFVSESVIRQSITGLENELGIKLFEHHGNSNVIPSVAGMQFISSANELLIEFQKLEEKVKSFNKKSYYYYNNMYDCPSP
ncbi:LysR family transcriptional regulator [Bacillus sp. AFS041924]|uniref:LysR family transcriptional regulator n=1 Tax=Bacillus sp. AFS041924 TaxID=2033503 RepID=UPI000BFB5B9E|nr:LysR family transcriptional regulator [Bacillus sp. AFS041924]PGS53869.1 hypothetical protein COC46_06620 [Bacillus sp. AFS041924]